MTDNDKKRIETKALNHLNIGQIANGAWEEGYKTGAIDECEYWQSKLKERDEIVSELHSLIFTKNVDGEESVFPNEIDFGRIKDLLTRYANLNLK